MELTRRLSQSKPIQPRFIITANRRFEVTVAFIHTKFCQFDTLIRTKFCQLDTLIRTTFGHTIPAFQGLHTRIARITPNVMHEKPQSSGFRVWRTFALEFGYPTALSYHLAAKAVGYIYPNDTQMQSVVYR